MSKEVPKEITDRLKKWEMNARVLRVCHGILTLSAIICSLLVASDLELFDKRILAFIAALSVGLLSGFGLGAKSNKMRQAWRKLNSAVLRYNVSPEYTVENLVKAYEESEKLIGDVTTDKYS